MIIILNVSGIAFSKEEKNNGETQGKKALLGLYLHKWSNVKNLASKKDMHRQQDLLEILAWPMPSINAL